MGGSKGDSQESLPAQPPRACILPSLAVPEHPENGLVRRQGPDLDDIPSTASSLHPQGAHTHPACFAASPPPWLALKLQNHCLPGPALTKVLRAGHGPAGHEW